MGFKFFDKFSNVFNKRPEKDSPVTVIPENQDKPEKTGGTIEYDPSRGFTVIGSNPGGNSVNIALFVAPEPPVWQEPKMPDVSEEENPEFLTRDMGLGGHHVSASHIHISMSVSYVAESHTVVYRHSSSQDPEEKKTYPIPPEVRTKAQLLWYLERKTDIPSVCWHYY